MLLLLEKLKLFLRLIANPPDAAVGTVMTTGDQPTAVGFNLAQLAVEPPTTAPQLYPHIGTAVPSGSVRVDGAAVKLICCWPDAIAATRGRRHTTRCAAFKATLILFFRIVFPLILVR
jgi:hypothetical protein